MRTLCRFQTFGSGPRCNLAAICRGCWSMTSVMFNTCRGVASRKLRRKVTARGGSSAGGIRGDHMLPSFIEGVEDGLDRPGQGLALPLMSGRPNSSTRRRTGGENSGLRHFVGGSHERNIGQLALFPFIPKMLRLRCGCESRQSHRSSETGAVPAPRSLPLLPPAYSEQGLR